MRAWNFIVYRHVETSLAVVYIWIDEQQGNTPLLIKRRPSKFQ